MPPNVVLFMTDQHRAGLTAGEGFELDTMPFLDSLAAQGTRFRRAYTATPLCVPARCSLLTGRFPKATRVRQNSTAEHVVRGDDLVDVFRRAGYRLQFNGKTHFYRQAEDFDDFAAPYGHLTGPPGAATGADAEFETWLKAFGHETAMEPTPFPARCQFPYRIVSDAIRAVDATPPDQSVFSWLSFPEPHNPYQVPEPYFSMFPEDQIPDRACGPEGALAKGGGYQWLREVVEAKRPGYDDDWRRYRANYCGMLRLIDDQLQRFVAHLSDVGRLEDTVFVFLADHGDYFADYGLQRKGAGLAECLVRIPMVVSGAGVRTDDNATDFVSLVDILPTMCDLVGAEIPLGVQGRSLLPILAGEDYPSEEFSTGYAEVGFGGVPWADGERPPVPFDYDKGREFNELNSFTQSGNAKMVRRGDWKLVMDSTGRGELYRLTDDPAELANRWDDPDCRSLREQLLVDLLRWTIRTEDDLPSGVHVPKRLPHNWAISPDPHGLPGTP